MATIECHSETEARTQAKQAIKKLRYKFTKAYTKDGLFVFIVSKSMTDRLRFEAVAR